MYRVGAKYNQSSHAVYFDKKKIYSAVNGWSSYVAPQVGQIILIGDFIAILLSLFLAPVATDLIYSYILFSGDEIITIADVHVAQRGLPYILGILLCLWFATKGHYTLRHPLSTEVKHIIAGIVLAALVNGYVQFALKAQPSRLWLTQTWVFAFLLIVGARLIVKYSLFQLGPWRLPTVVVGSHRRITDVQSLIDGNWYLGYEMRAVLPVAGSVRDLKPALDHIVATSSPRYAVIAFDDEKVKETHNLAYLIEQDYRIPLGIIPPLRGISLIDLEVQKFFGHDLILLNNSRQADRILCFGFKRLFDITLASLLLLSLAPLMLIIAVLVKLDGGPALYGSPRLGRGGRVFKVLKFRSMVPDAERVLREMLTKNPALRQEWEQNFKLRCDPRITRIGRYLRETSLDELPQLWNVLKGEMSLVGPRPLLLDEQHFYSGDAFALYSEVMPGVTGMWQVSGRDDVEYYRRIELNNWYIKNWSPWNDFIILFKTLFIIIRRKGVS